METTGHALSVGCLVMRGNDVLLVKRNAGPTQGSWDFPRGQVRVGESMESACIREVQEQAAVVINPVRIITLRQQVGVVAGGGAVSDLLVVWLLEHLWGEPAPDLRGIVEAAWLPLEKVWRATDTTAFLKEMLRAVGAGGGLKQGGYQPQRLPEHVRHWRAFVPAVPGGHGAGGATGRQSG